MHHVATSQGISPKTDCVIADHHPLTSRSSDVEGLSEAADVLASCYREQGVVGGGGGALFGLYIDHILHAIVGTPTLDGLSSPRRTVAGLGQPLMALIEVAYLDALLPMLDEVSVARPTWARVGEMLKGQASQIVSHAAHHKACEPHLRAVIGHLVGVYGLMRQCGPGAAVTFHVKQPEYTKDAAVSLPCLCVRLAECAVRAWMCGWVCRVEVCRGSCSGYGFLARAAHSRSTLSPLLARARSLTRSYRYRA